MDCIDPKEGDFLRGIMEMSAEDIREENWRHCGDLLNARLHWSGCPSCRAEFGGLPPLFQQIGLELQKNCGAVVSGFRDEFLKEKNSILAEGNDLARAYAQVIVALALWKEDVLIWVKSGQATVSLAAPSMSGEESAQSSYGAMESSLAECNECRDFISSLHPDVQQFVFAVACSDDLFVAVYESAQSEYEKRPGSDDKEDFAYYYDVLWARMHKAIAALHPGTLFSVIERASIAYSSDLEGWPKGAVSTVIQTGSARERQATQETKSLRGVMQEWKQDFDNLEDSLKAGQMELVRLIEHNRRPAVAYEPQIIAQLGDQLYSRLQQRTQRALQLVEYLYSINQEPDGFALFAVRMAQSYENELVIRVVWPFVDELRAADTRTYDAGGKAKEPLIRYGKISERGMTLGSLAWYLNKDPTMRGNVSGRGFDVGAISKDAEWVSGVRNKAAHDFACDRTLADELRRRILSHDGILSRLHPIDAAAAVSLTA
jgi:hypothetical protein